MTQTHDDPSENAAGSEVRAGAPAWSVRTADSPLVPNTPRAASGRGVFVSHRHTPRLQPMFPSQVRSLWPGRSSCCEEESMFEGQSQTELEALMKANTEFRQLYHRHKELDKQVLDAELGVLPIDDTRLVQMKREKLAAKDRLTRMYDALHH
jgi:uncharacterized protein